MKYRLLIVLFVIFNIMTILTDAQNTKTVQNGCKRNGFMGQIPDLTEEQKAKISEIRVMHIKVSNDLRNKLKEKRAHLKILTSADNPNQKDIDATIDEITTLQNELMKNNIAMRMEIRNQLTEVQRIYFDTHHVRQKKLTKKYRLTN